MSYHMNGVGGCGCPGQCGMGAYYYDPDGLMTRGGAPYAGYGAMAPGGGSSGGGSGIRQSFNGEQVWADASLGGSIGAIIAAGNEMGCSGGKAPAGAGEVTVAACAANWSEQGRANVAGLRALDQIRRALTELGYGKLNTGGAINGADREAWAKYTTERGLPGAFVNKPAIMGLESDLKSGKGKSGIGLGVMLMLAAGAAAVVAVVSGKKRTSPATGKAMVPVR